MWSQAFHMEERSPPPPLPSPPHSLPTLPGCTCEVQGPTEATLCPFLGGVCCSILMTKKGAGARSHYHTLICLKRARSTIQSAGVHRNPVKAGGCVSDKRQKQPHFFFVPGTRPAQFQSAVRLSPKPRPASCISMGVFPPKERSTAA